MSAGCAASASSFGATPNSCRGWSSWSTAASCASTSPSRSRWPSCRGCTPGRPRASCPAGSSSSRQWSDVALHGRGGEFHRAAEPAVCPAGESEGPVVGFGDALDDRQAEADACVVGAYASAAARKRLGQRGDQVLGETLARVLDGEHHAVGVSAGGDPHGALVAPVVADRVVHEGGGELEQEGA